MAILKKVSIKDLQSFGHSFLFSFRFNVLSFKLFDKYIFGFRTVKQFNEFYNNIKLFKKVDIGTIKKIKNLHEKNRFFLDRNNCYNN